MQKSRNDYRLVSAPQPADGGEITHPQKTH